MPLFGKKKDEKQIDNTAVDGHGQTAMPNPGELPPDWQERGLRLTSLGTIPARGSRAGGGDIVDTGARVGYQRNLEFSAGGRSAIIRTGTTSTSVPHISPTTGQTQVSSATGDEVSAGNANPNQPPMPGLAKDGGDQVDATVGPASDRRRDRRLD